MNLILSYPLKKTTKKHNTELDSLIKIKTTLAEMLLKSIYTSLGTKLNTTYLNLLVIWTKHILGN